MFKIFLFVAVIFTDQVLSLPFDESQTEPDYDGCGNDDQCFGMPDNCIDKKTCTVLLKTKPIPTGVEFKLFWKLSVDSRDRYVSAGLSDDRLMGNDSVTIVVLKDSGSVDAYHGFTFGGYRGFGVNRVSVDGVQYVDNKYENGLMTSTWRETQVTKVEGKTFDLVNNKYFIFLVYGPIDNQGTYGPIGNPVHHSHKWTSKEAVVLGKK